MAHYMTPNFNNDFLHSRDFKRGAGTFRIILTYRKRKLYTLQPKAGVSCDTLISTDRRKVPLRTLLKVTARLYSESRNLNIGVLHPLLANDHKENVKKPINGPTTAVARQWLKSDHVRASTDANATMAQQHREI
jgi:hypothetical protein